MKNIYEKEKNDHENGYSNHKVTINRRKTTKSEQNRPRSTKMLRFKRKLTKRKVEYTIKSRE